MKLTGILSKMLSTPNSPIIYELDFGEERLNLTTKVGKHLKLSYSGTIRCVHCGKKTKKSYAQGHCYPCTMKLASCDLCILKPETCHFEKGTCREPSWGEENCFKAHVVYLANSSGLKVGITRKTQVPTRWIDQGAAQALPILEVKNRFISGQVEMLFKKHISDKTDWRKMLRGDPAPMDLLQWRDKLLVELKEEVQKFDPIYVEEKVFEFSYPVDMYPEKVTSFNLDKVSDISGKLLGIKGQYLIFDTGVFNVRAHTGYEVTIEEIYVS